MPELPDGEIRWMLSLWESLRPDKLWVIPRSETVFQRQGDQLVFLEGDETEFAVNRQHFALIGVEVVR